MLSKYVRSGNSEKYYNKMQIPKEQCFDLTLADMDIGVYQPLHHKVISTFANMQSHIIKVQHTLNHTEQIQSIEHNYQTLAKNAIINWYSRQHDCDIALRVENSKNVGNEVDVLFCTSIVSLCSYSIMATSQPNQAILIMTPVYSSYMTIINKLKRKPVQTCLKYQKSSAANTIVGNFFIDFQNMQKVMKEEKVKVLLLSHPHNPSGRVWTQNEVKIIVSICKKYDVVIVSDQILGDLTFNDKDKQFYSLAREFKQYNKIIIGNSVSKAFNYSSIQAGYAITADPTLHSQIAKVIASFGETVDQLGLCTIVGCLTKEGQVWLSIVRAIMQNNYTKLLVFRQCRAPFMEIALLQAAYLVYLDLTKYFVNADQMRQKLKNQNIYVIQLGSNYMPEKKGTLQIRVCIACEQDHFDRFLVKLDKILRETIKTKQIPKL